MSFSRAEFVASEKFFLATGQSWAKLTPTEQRKLVEVEIERVSEGDISSVPGRDSNS